MANTYLTTTYPERQDAKALGARWDATASKWFVPDGYDLTPFRKWLPAGAVPAISQDAPPQQEGTQLAMHGKKGVSLSSLLAGVSQAVAQAYKAGVWTMVEVVELRVNNGHVFMGVSERDAHGAVLAKASASIWQSTANVILPKFESATGAQLAPGIKLLVRARPVFKPMHGFSLEITDIDSEYTLGDLEARKREIRARLQAEGVFDANKNLPPPWDFNSVLVVAPAGGAGLGDFQAEADRLVGFGICTFTYAYSRFQGEGAAKEICDALMNAVDEWMETKTLLPDAVVIIRGGGAVNDLAWLNDYDLARTICDLPIPVLTGIGHERDSTLLDEVAHLKFDTPSKVIAGIEQLIGKRTTEAMATFLQLFNMASKAVQSSKSATQTLDLSVRAESFRHLARAKQSTSENLSDIRIGSMQTIQSAAEQSLELLQVVKTHAVAQISDAKRNVPLFWGGISMGAAHAIQTASREGKTLLGSVLERGRQDASRAKQSANNVLTDLTNSAGQTLREARDRSEALMREITGQGPEKTLNRGFALVRDPSGKPISRASHVMDGAAIEIQFQDGRILATTEKNV